MNFLDLILTKIFGSKQDREVNRLMPMVEQVNALEPKIKALSDEELRAQTDLFKQRIANGESLESLIPEAFAVVREAAWRVVGMRPFDVQIMGGIVLFEGKIAEMATGEGKTLVATLPCYLMGLTGKGVHVVTVNDYLARRDCEWMGPIHQSLGLTVGYIQHDQAVEDKIVAYNCDITYGTNNEFGFDYLRSNLTISPEERPQRELHYAIVDEVDSILVDEARTPLIISGAADIAPENYYRVNSIISFLRPGRDFTVDEKDRIVLMTEEGMENAQRLLGLENMFEEENLEIVHYLDQALRAHFLFEKDVHYVVQDGEVIIVDEFTGRLMPGRRWSDGLHQAIEAKENVKIERENQTLATITFQNYFRMYDKLAGMTGTADTEAAEFAEIYSLDVVVIPTNRPCIREDRSDQVYRTEKEKFEAIAAEIIDCQKRHQPVLVGTISIEKSEHLGDLLKNRGYWRKRSQDWVTKIREKAASIEFPSEYQVRLDELLQSAEQADIQAIDQLSDELDQFDERLAYFVGRWAETLEIMKTVTEGIPFNVLNAKFHGKEAAIVAQAGRPGNVTIATNMAGRGTDIVLGGNPEKMIEDEVSKLDPESPGYAEKVAEIEKRFSEECAAGRKQVLDAGGLAIIGSERHESRRIDNQLRGRSGRQGDPGWSRFFLSLEDDLMRLFGGERIQRIASRFGMEDGEVIEAKLVSKSIRRAQKKVEDRNFEIRKHVIKYDDVMNKQREVIYRLRNDLLEGGDPEVPFRAMLNNTFEDLCDNYLDVKLAPEEWDIKGLQNSLFHLFNFHTDVEIPDEGTVEQLVDGIRDSVKQDIDDLYQSRKESAPSEEEWNQLMRFIMLTTVDQKWKDHLLTMDHLRDAIGLRGYGGKDPLQEFQKDGFEAFELMYINLERDVVAKMFRVVLVPQEDSPVNRRARRNLPKAQIPAASGPVGTKRRGQPKVGRNDPCPCGSGKKFKKCCMTKSKAG